VILNNIKQFILTMLIYIYSCELYMDQHCLVNFNSGKCEFSDINVFFEFNSFFVAVTYEFLLSDFCQLFINVEYLITIIHLILN